jgi:ketosteroid isomerase-like protein
MPERARRMLSFLLAAAAIFAVGRVVIAYATRPSRWSTRLALPEIDAGAREARMLPMAITSGELGVAPQAAATSEDLAAIGALRVASIAAISRGNVDAYVRCFARDVVTFTSSGTAIVGAQDLANETATTLRAARSIAVSLVPSELRVLGHAVLEDGRFSLQLRSGEADVISKGRYAALWKREFGDWRIVFEAVRADGDQSAEG